jgi:hypothetical protein
MAATVGMVMKIIFRRNIGVTKGISVVYTRKEHEVHNKSVRLERLIIVVRISFV